MLAPSMLMELVKHGQYFESLNKYQAEMEEVEQMPHLSHSQLNSPLVWIVQAQLQDRITFVS